MKGLINAARGSHYEVEVTREVPGGLEVKHHGRLFVLDKDAVTLLLPNETFTTILWAGGWDEYVVDLSTARPQTNEEMNLQTNPITEDRFLRGQFVNHWDGKEYINTGPFAFNQCAKITRHLGRGD